MKNIIILLLFTIGTVIPITKYNYPARKRTLVLIDNALLYMTHSRFFDHLREQGHQLSIQHVSTVMLSRGDINLHKDKEWLYDNLFIFCTGIEIYQQSKDFNIQQFYDAGNNIFFVFDTFTSKTFRDLANTFGIDIHPEESQLVDYHHALDITQPHIFQAWQFGDNPLAAEGVNGPIIYNGVGMSDTYYQNEQFITFMRGNVQTASIDRRIGATKRYHKMGRHNQLALGIQGLNNARALAVGSLDMLSNELIQKSEGQNLKYVSNLVDWVSHGRGILRKVSSSYSCIDKEGNDSDCPVRTQFRYSIEVRIKY